MDAKSNDMAGKGLAIGTDFSYIVSTQSALAFDLETSALPSQFRCQVITHFNFN